MNINDESAITIEIIEESVIDTELNNNSIITVAYEGESTIMQKVVLNSLILI